MDNTLSFAVGDPVNWEIAGAIVYGFVEEDCPPGTPRLKLIEVEDLRRARRRVPFERLRPTP